MINKKSILILSLFFSLTINKSCFSPPPKTYSFMHLVWAKPKPKNDDNKPKENNDHPKNPKNPGYITNSEAWFLLGLDF